MRGFSIFLAAVAIIAVWGTWAFLPAIVELTGIPLQGEYAFGVWGDTFGALSALFAGLGFIGLILNLQQQQKQIDARERDQHIQRFEGTFFQLLKLLHDVLDEVRLGFPSDAARKIGGAAFSAAFIEIRRALEKATIHDTLLNKQQVADYYISVVDQEAEHELGPYYRILYTILGRISDDDFLADYEKAKYGNIVRGQLASAEVALIGLNSLTEESNDRRDRRDLIVEFRLLKYLPEGIVRKVLEQHIDAAAFEARD